MQVSPADKITHYQSYIPNLCKKHIFPLFISSHGRWRAREERGWKIKSFLFSYTWRAKWHISCIYKAKAFLSYNSLISACATVLLQKNGKGVIACGIPLSLVIMHSPRVGTAETPPSQLPAGGNGGGMVTLMRTAKGYILLFTGHLRCHLRFHSYTRAETWPYLWKLQDWLSPKSSCASNKRYFPRECRGLGRDTWL